MKRLFSIILAILCLLTMLLSRRLQPMQVWNHMVLPVRGMIRKISRLTVRRTRQSFICSLTVRMWPRVGARQSQKHKLTIKL